MADLVFDFLTKFGKALVVAVGDEDRVVAKAGSATFFGGYLPFNNTFKECLMIAAGIVGIVLNE